MSTQRLPNRRTQPARQTSLSPIGSMLESCSLCRIPNRRVILRQRGVTLVELMVALTIGLFLSAGVIALYLGMTSTYRVTESQGDVSENGRFALEMLARDIRQAGYDPQSPADQPWVEDYIFGWDDTNPTMTDDTGTTTWTANDWESGTDAIRLTHAAPEVGCNPATDLCTEEDPIDYIYYIGTDSDGTNLGLRLTKIDPNESAPDTNGLIPNVVDMQIFYATGKRIDNFTRPVLDSGYRPANELAAEDWENVFAVKISLLVKSENTNAMEEPMTLNFDGTSWTAPDKALYRQFHGYATIRNRLP
ncbi:PilW family protein [Thiorhodovibrio frisius]|uniref:Prepilin-type N-terminal cleavage/methylation domain-containing protein n=1 Tax=Thiorhodovibrio frisius TaxID=631362 RepID=H8YXH5_9GAMM|nr:PilW family protein [Thiorhodovibrio frisius]EIC23151.1 prepilin-type N-terminal cleavage/methylation domain-containing protein [Thiorhodovibrio frisius]WPL22578.1 Tfp pilus assembly protein PilW [Thiorhodovibrio frisius]